jgi:hypothetical protein
MPRPPSFARPEMPPENERHRSPRAVFAPREDLGPPTASIGALRPTQMTVGYREVAGKRDRWRPAVTAMQPLAPPRWTVPVVVGPSAKLYALDRHHWMCALAAEGVSDVPVIAIEDLAHLDEANFWSILENRNWCHPYDTLGRRRPWKEMPTSMAQLMDDPFRSLASALRRAGGFVKHPAPFSEFAWVTHLRRHIPLSLVEHDFGAALREALRLSSDHFAATAQPTSDRSTRLAAAANWRRFQAAPLTYIK